MFSGPWVGGGVNMNKIFLYYVAKMFRFFCLGVNMNKLFSKIFYYVAKKEFFFVGGGLTPLQPPQNTYDGSFLGVAKPTRGYFVIE